MKARVHSHLKPGVLDPQGKAIGNALDGLGFAGVRRGAARQGDRAGPRRPATPPRPRPQVEEMCGQLLANPVIENYRVSVSG